MPAKIKVGGVTPFTTIDFPNHISCVLFLQGCPWNCPYCHNQHLIDMKADASISWDDVIAFLKTRVNLLDGVVFSGGEPLSQPGLLDAIKEIRDMGFFAALHTNGYNPDALTKVLPLLTWVGLDVKVPFAAYGDKIGANADGKKVEKSLKLIAGSGLPYEVRTTLDPRLLDKSSVLEIAGALTEYGVKTYALQQYRAYEGEDGVPTIPEITQFFKDEAFLGKIRALLPEVILREA